MEQRSGPERRRLVRGGRRETDVPGFAPLILVVEQDERGREVTEAILARLRFAVAPCDSVEKAVTILQGLRPDVIIATSRAANLLRLHAPSDGDGGPIPIVSLTDDDMRTADALVEAVRRALTIETW